MVIQVLHCAHCQSQNVIRHGKDKAGHQRYRCHDCRRTCGNPQEQADSRARREQLQAHALAAYRERASMRGVCRIFGVGRNTLSGWLKKARQLPPLQETLAPARLDDVLELDELWSFVARRKDKRWVWLALCRRTRQIVAYALGDRGQKTCRLLWERIPLALRHALAFTDFWEAYQKVVPEGQHVACGKGSGQTNHITPIKPRALQQHAPAASGTVRAEDALVQQVRRDARGLPAAVPAPLQHADGTRHSCEPTTRLKPLSKLLIEPGWN